MRTSCFACFCSVRTFQLSCRSHCSIALYDSLGSKDCCANTNLFSYLLTYLPCFIQHNDYDRVMFVCICRLHLSYSDLKLSDAVTSYLPALAVERCIILSVKRQKYDVMIQILPLQSIEVHRALAAVSSGKWSELIKLMLIVIPL